MKPQIPIAILLAALATTGCEAAYFSAEVTAQEVCIIDMATQFPPAPGSGAELATVLQTSIGEDDLGVRLADELDIDVQVLSVAVAPRANITDLSFVDSFSVSVGADGSVLPIIKVVDLTPQNLEAGILYGEPSEAVDVTAHIRAGELQMDFELRGALPTQSWEANIDLCLSTQAKYTVPF